MSNPFEAQHVGDGEVNAGNPALQGAVIQEDDGPAVSVAAQLRAPAGMSSSQPVAASAPGTSEAALELLRRTVTDLERQGSATFAAGVAARMKQYDPTFDVRREGFKSFTAFLAYASDKDVVRVARQDGTSDLTVTSTSAPKPAGGVPDMTGRFLRQDLWAALTRTAGSSFWWNRDSAELVGPMPTQPEEAGAWVELRPVTRDALTSWMRDFVSTLSDSTRATALEATLSTASPVEDFIAEVRSHQGTGRKWGRLFRDHVMRHALSWAEGNAVPREELFRSPTAQMSGTAAPTSSRPRVGSASGEPDHYEREARAAVMSAVERMPLADLLRLPIPAEYLIRR